MLVNRYFRDAIQVISNQNHRFVLSDTIERSMLKQRRLQESVVLQNLRHLTVANDGPWEEYNSSRQEGHDEFLERFEPFNEYVRSIRSLRTLIWNAGPVPETLLAVLRDFHPRAKLKVFDFTRFRPYDPNLDKSEIALSRFTNLTHFRFSGKSNALLRTGVFFSKDDVRNNYPAFLSIVAGALTLEYAGFVAAANWDGRLPMRKDSRRCVIKSLTLDMNFNLSRAILTDVNKYVDLSEVRSLKFSRGMFEHDFFDYAPTFFTGLQHLSMNLNYLYQMDERSHSVCITSIKKFFLQCLPLQTISLWSWTKALDLGDILPRHGSELRTLQLHERERTLRVNDDGSSTCIGIFTPNDLKLIRQSCPKLTDLTVDMPFEAAEFEINDDPDLCAKLAEMALFKPTLQMLRIYFDETSMEDHDTDVLRYVTSIWKRIYGTRTTGERRLEVKFGEWEARQWRPAETDWRRFYQIVPHDRDDLPGECRVDCRKKG